MGLGDRRLRRRLRDSPGCYAPGATSASGSRLPTPPEDGVKGSTPTASASRLARVLRTGRDLSERGGRRLRDMPRRRAR